jgi:phage-related minor tail protein
VSSPPKLWILFGMVVDEYQRVIAGLLAVVVVVAGVVVVVGNRRR